MLWEEQFKETIVTFDVAFPADVASVVTASVGSLLLLLLLPLLLVVMLLMLLVFCC